MLAVEGVYDGRKVELLEKVNAPENKLQKVIVTFLNEEVDTERFAYRLGERSRISGDPEQLKRQLASMSADPEVQAELRKINYEFSITEADGLEFE